MSWLLSTLGAFVRPPDPMATSTWSEARGASKRFSIILATCGACILLVLWMLVAVMSAAGRPFPEGMWSFFPGRVLTRLYALFTPVLFAVLIWATLRLRSKQRPFTLPNALAVSLDATSATIALMIAVLVAPYLVLLATAMSNGLNETTNVILSGLATWQAIAVPAIWLIYTSSVAGLIAANADIGRMYSLALTLIAGVATLAIAALLDPYVFALSQKYWHW